MTASPTTQTAPAETMRPRRAPFSETHRRTVNAPIDAVWEATLSVTPGEIRLFGPLIALRGLPARVRGRAGVADTAADASLLDLFESEGFVPLLSVSVGSHRTVEYGAIGRFWSVAENHPVHFADADAFAAFDEPGYARIWFDLTLDATSDGTEITTTTIVDGTDRRAERRFAPYWAIIRGPSGLIRRSWLAAIDRRARS